MRTRHLHSIGAVNQRTLNLAQYLSASDEQLALADPCLHRLLHVGSDIGIYAPAAHGYLVARRKRRQNILAHAVAAGKKHFHPGSTQRCRNAVENSENGALLGHGALVKAVDHDESRLHARHCRYQQARKGRVDGFRRAAFGGDEARELRPLEV